MEQYYQLYDTEIGDVVFVGTESGITKVLFGTSVIPEGSEEETTSMYDAIIELNQYLFGQRKSFSAKLVIDPKDQKIIDWINAIPYGKFRTFEELSDELGLGLDPMATAKLVASLPIHLFVPTHRLLSKANKLLAYPGGIDMKMKLLKMEIANK